jgi:hypothetical protein
MAKGQMRGNKEKKKPKAEWNKKKKASCPFAVRCWNHIQIGLHPAGQEGLIDRLWPVET